LNAATQATRRYLATFWNSFSSEPADGLNDTIVGVSPDAIIVTDPDGFIIYRNAVAAECFGIPVIVTSVAIDQLFPGAVAGSVGRCLRDAQAGATGRVTVSYRVGNGDPRWWDIIASPVQGPGGIGRIVFVARDVTDLRRAHLEAEWLSEHDALTGLPNRLVLHRQLTTEIDAARENGTKIAVFLVDVDDFKQINDTRGHAAGDIVLSQFATTFKHHAMITQAARIGGDEFAVITKVVANVDAAARVAEALAAQLGLPVAFEGSKLDCRASIGVAVFPDHAKDGDLLVRNADIALYAAKSFGRGGYSVYSAGMRTGLATRAQQIEVACDALRLDTIEPGYQPKIDLKTGRLIGFEALLRYRDVHADIVAPSKILAALADPDCGAALGQRMQDLVFADLRRWTREFAGVGRISLNASVADFNHDDFPQRFLEKIGRHELQPQQVEIEVVESVFLGRRAGKIEKMLRYLSQAGVNIALDDFGTGYASLTHLNEFPINTIKIDKSFLPVAGAPQRSGEIIRAIVSLAKALELETVAEGIETIAQAEFVRDIGCSVAQGYLFGPAIAAKNIPAFLSGHQLPTQHM
jgi:diguanylate cyclase (GGDEF)-like protein/PAS domain S-box-containing protein